MTTPSTHTSNMKEAEQVGRDLLRELIILRDQIQQFVTQFGEADFYTGGATEAIAKALPFFGTDARSLVEAQPSAGAGEAPMYAVMPPSAMDWLTSSEPFGAASQEWQDGWDACRNYVSMRVHKVERDAAPSAVLPLQGEVPDAVWEALQRLIENGLMAGQGSAEDARTVARHRDRVRFMAAGEGAAAPSVEPEEDAEDAKQLRALTAAASVETEQPILGKSDAYLLRLWDDMKGYYTEWCNSTPDVLRAEFVKALAARPTPAAGVPPGFVTVPSEPTPEMIRAGENSAGRSTSKMMESHALIYRDMLAARPLPGADPKDNAK